MIKIDKDSLHIRLQAVWRLFCMIAACVLTAMGIVSLFGLYASQIPSSILWQIPLMAFGLAFISSFIYPIQRAMGRFEKWIRILIHYVLICAIVMISGYALDWYDRNNMQSVCIMLIMVTSIFVILSFISWRKSDAEAESLNVALSKMQKNKDE